MTVPEVMVERAVVTDFFVFGSLYIVVDQYGVLVELAVEVDHQFRMVSGPDRRRLRDNR